MTMVAATVVVTSPADLAALRRGPAPRAVSLRVPGKPPREAAQREARLAAVLGDCGCGIGAGAVLVGLALVPFLSLTGSMHRLPVWAVGGRVLLWLAVWALAGSAIGRLRATLRRRAALDDLARWMAAPG